MAVRDSFSRIFGLGEKTDNEEISQIPVEDIVPNPYQPRTVFDDEKIDELCQTIRTHGLIQPIVVRVRDGRYELIAGERRLRATKKLGMERIPAIIKEFNDAQTASIALIENLQREGLTAIEEAVAYQKLIDLHNLTQESLAQRLGKGQSTVANKLRLLNLPQPIQDSLMARQLTERHARALIPLKDETLQLKVMQEILEREWNVKQTEVRVKQLLEADDKPQKEKAARPKWKAFSRDARIAINTVRQSIDMVMQTGLPVQTDEEDHDEFYQFTIRIPKGKEAGK